MATTVTTTTHKHHGTHWQWEQRHPLQNGLAEDEADVQDTIQTLSPTASTSVCAGSVEDGETEQNDDDATSIAERPLVSEENKDDSATQRLPPTDTLILKYFGMSSWSELWRNLVCNLKETIQTAGPLTVTYVSNSVLQMEDMAFVGHLGSRYLAAAALANSYSYCLTFVIWGLTSGLDTLVSNSYGAGNRHLIRVLLLRGLTVMTVAAIPIMAMFLLAEPFFLVLGQDPEVARLTGYFCMLLIPGMVFSSWYRVYVTYLVAQQRVLLQMFIAISALVVNAILNWMFIFGFGMGFAGAPIATSLCRLLQFVSLIIAIAVIDRAPRSKSDPSSEISSDTESVNIMSQLLEALRPSGILQFLKYAIPGSVATMLEVIGWESSVIIAGFLGEAVVAAHGIVLNLTLITFCVPLGISIGGTVRVGAKLGERRPKQAKFAALMTVAIAMLVMVFNGIILASFRSLLGKIFTDDETVLSLVRTIIIFGALFQVFDGLNVACGGVLRAMGAQRITVVGNLFAYYLIGLPVGYALAFIPFIRLGINGVWIGLFIGLMVASLTLLSVILFRTDWQKESDAALLRASESFEKRDTEDDIEDSISLASADGETSMESEIFD